jgi:integrase
MAAPVKDGNVWRHRIQVGGKRVSGTFDTKAAALAWEADQRVQIKGGPAAATRKTMADAFTKYELEVSKKKRSHLNEAKRLAAFRASSLADIRVSELRAADIAAWRDTRLEKVKGSSVNRDMNLLSHVLTIARKEWHWLDASPSKDVARPENPPARDRLITEGEIDAICLALGLDRATQWSAPTTKQYRIALAFLWAIETAMRAGEICALRKGDVTGRVARLHMTKNGTPRSVPLSAAALAIWEVVPDGFELDSKGLDTLFRKAKERSGVKGLTFHDTRHEAITRLAKKLHVLDLARMVGHKDIRQLMRYYNESAEDIAAKL